MSWQKHIRDAAVHAVDQIADRVGDSGEKVIHRLAQQWRTMDDEDKRELMEVVVAIGTAAGIAVAAFRQEGTKKSKTRTLAKKAGRTALEKAARTTAKTLNKVKKK